MIGEDEVPDAQHLRHQRQGGRGRTEVAVNERRPKSGDLAGEVQHGIQVVIGRALHFDARRHEYSEHVWIDLGAGDDTHADG